MMTSKVSAAHGVVPTQQQDPGSEAGAGHVAAEVLAHYAPRAGAVTAALVEQARVRIVRGGYRGDLARITGRGLAGGVTVTTDSGVPLALPLDAVAAVGA